MNDLKNLASTSAPHPTSRKRRREGWAWVGGGVMLALALTPLVFDPAARDDAFFLPKWAWISCWTALGMAVALSRAAFGRAIRFPLNALWGAMLAFAAWHWVAVCWAPSRSLAVERAWQITALTAAAGVGLQFLARRRALLALAWVFIAVSDLTALWVLAEDAVRAWWPAQVWIHPNLPDWRGYLVGGLGNTNHLGDLLALALLVTLTLFGEARNRRARLILFASAIVQPAALIVCFSVGSNLGLIAGALLMLVLILRRDRGRWYARRRRRWLALGLAWVLLLVFFNTDHPLNPHRPGIIRQGFDSARWVEGGPTRLAIWAQSLEMIRLHPLRGVGTGNFTYVFPEMDSRLLWDRPDLRVYQGLYTNAAHNELLQTWNELGIAGLFLILTLIGLAFHSLLKDLADAGWPNFLARLTLAGMLLGWVAQAQMNFCLQHPAGALTFYGLLLATVIERWTRDRGPRMPSLRQQVGPLALDVEWRSMSQPTALGVAFVLPRAAAWTLSALLIGGVVAWAPLRWRPVGAQREYQRGFVAESKNLNDLAEQHFKAALALDPDATGARSHYSAWLLRQGRPAETLAQMLRVRERLNSNELWQREAQAQAALGQMDQARQSYQTGLARQWSLRQSLAGQGMDHPHP